LVIKPFAVSLSTIVEAKSGLALYQIVSVAGTLILPSLLILTSGKLILIKVCFRLEISCTAGGANTSI